jgi:dCMP deaminase
MSKWGSRFMDLARLVASWSKDPSTQVGAVIVDNDAPVDREVKLLRTIHAEENALLFARRDVTGMSVYVTRPPCARCAAKLVQAGIVRVVYDLPPVDFVERWALEMREAQAMFADVGVAVTVLGEAC